MSINEKNKNPKNFENNDFLAAIFPAKRNTFLASNRLIGQVIPQEGLLLVPPLEALAPPGALGAGLHRLQHETLSLHDVEEQLAHHVGDRCIGKLEARTEPGGQK